VRINLELQSYRRFVAELVTGDATLADVPLPPQKLGRVGQDVRPSATLHLDGVVHRFLQRVRSADHQRQVQLDRLSGIQARERAAAHQHDVVVRVERVGHGG